MKLKGKKALVTAAGQGIGRSTAELFAENGAEVFACDINQDTLSTLNGMKTIQADRGCRTCLCTSLLARPAQIGRW